MNTEPIELAACRLVLDLIRREELPGVALACLEQGCESTSIIWLAGLSRDEMFEARSLFERAMAELGVRIPGRWEAVVRLAREEARSILDGRVSAFAGAERIYRLTLLAHPEVGDHALDTFLYAALEWPGRPDDAAIFEPGVIAAASDLVEG